MSNHVSKRESQVVATAQPLSLRKTAIIMGLIAGAFLLSYNFASAQSSGQALQPGALSQAAGAGGCGMAGGSGGGGCCGGGGGAPVEATTAVEGGVQTIAVDTSTGSFNPNVIKAKAGVPTEIAFSQAPGGCLSGVLFPDLGISEDLTAGGKTVKLPALEPGEYQFFCQMQMLSAKIVVE